MNAKFNVHLWEGSQHDEDHEEALLEEEAIPKGEEVMEAYIKLEGCENGYILTLVEFSGDDWDREEVRWVASTTSELKQLLDNVIPDIQHDGVE